MALETGSFLNDLVATNPVHATDTVSKGDDHIRLIKALLLATFPNLTAAMTATAAELNVLDGYTGSTADLEATSGLATELALLAGLTATAAELNTLDGVTSTTDELNILDGLLADVTELNLLNGLTTLSGANTGDEVAASITVAGVSGLATTAEGDTGTDTALVTTVAVAKSMIDTHSGLAFISSQDASTSATLDFTGFDATLYDSYLYTLSNIIPATDTAVLQLLLSDDEGSTYEADAADYAWAASRVGPGTTGGSGSASDTKISLCYTGIGNAATEEGVSGSVEIYGPGLAKKTQVLFSLFVEDAAGAYHHL